MSGTPVELYRSQAGQREIDALYSRSLAALPFPCQQISVQTPSFGRANVVACGPLEAPPLMLWQGACGPAPYMLAGCAPLAERFRIFSPDTPCQGGSRSEARILDPARHEYGLWCVQVMEQLGVLQAGAGAPPPLHIGVSLGGAILLDVAQVAPEAIRGGALLVPGGLHPGYGGWRQRLSLMLHLSLPWALYCLLPTRWTAWLALRGVADEPLAGDPLLEHLLLVFRHVRFYPPGPGRFLREQLQRCRAPMLVIAAEHDVFGGGAATAARARRVLPDCTAEVVPGARCQVPGARCQVPGMC